MKKILPFLAFILLFNVLNAQNIEFDKKNFPNDKEGFKEANERLKEGNKFFEQGYAGFPTALENYKVAQKFNPNNALLNYRIGVCYFNLSDKKKSIPFFEKALELNPSVSPDVKFLLAMAYQNNYEFDKAIEKYKAYRQSLSPKDLAEKSAEVDKYIDECNIGKKLTSNPVRVFIDNLGPVINSSYPDYSPIINGDETQLFFTSRRDNTTGGAVDPYNGGYFEDIYYSLKVNGAWAIPVNPGKPLNSETHDAIVGLSPDGQRLYIYKGDNGGDIYECKLNGDEWSKPKALSKEINTEYHESSAAFSYDLKTIYFVSNRPGGYGQHDIWLSKQDAKGRWSAPVNLGAEINTPYDEEGIFVHPDGKTIYFSSKGHSTMGGYDVFKSVYENGKWSEPENLGYPINTPDDDVFFTVSANGLHGYYSSAATGGFGNHDIYMVTFLGPEKPVIFNSEDNLIAIFTEPVKETVIEPVVEIKAAQLTILKGTITDEVTKEPLQAVIEITDNSINQVIATFESNSKTGKYLVSLPSGKNYGIAVKAENCLFHSENIDLASTSEFNEVTKDIQLKRIAVGSKVVLKNIFFDTGKSTLRPESQAELDRLVKLMNDVPKLKIEISGHTDNVGTAQYNKKLSNDRAKAVVDYLVSKGISADRMTYVGYGFDQPIAPNDSDSNRQLNRRTEFKVLEN